MSLSRKSDAAVLYVPQGALTQTAAKFAEKPCAEAIGTGSKKKCGKKPAKTFLTWFWRVNSALGVITILTLILSCVKMVISISLIIP